MNPENKAFLDSNRHHWETLRDADYCRHLDGATRENMRRVMAEEFRPGYSADLWCPPCVSEMVRSLYRAYDDWLAAQPPVQEVVDDFHRRRAEMIEECMRVTKDPPSLADALKAKTDESAKPIQIKATFPNHKSNNRRR